jgi:hypothetical protein
LKYKKAFFFSMVALLAIIGYYVARATIDDYAIVAQGTVGLAFCIIVIVIISRREFLMISLLGSI